MLVCLQGYALFVFFFFNKQVECRDPILSTLLKSWENIDTLSM